MGNRRLYALVAYIEGPLGEFLYRLRQEIVPACKLRSHVSILPPRPLAGTEEEAGEMLRRNTLHQPAFQIELGNIEVFSVTNVIFVALDRGTKELCRMHDDLNTGPLYYGEPFRYHPHITLAQELSTSEYADALQLCQCRWREYCGPRAFPVETLVFVRNAPDCTWSDLLEAPLELAGSRR